MVGRVGPDATVELGRGRVRILDPDVLTNERVRLGANQGPLAVPDSRT